MVELPLTCVELAEYANGNWTRFGAWSSATGSYSQHGDEYHAQPVPAQAHYGPSGRLHVAASRASGYTDRALRYDAASLNAFGEVVVDEQRVRSQGVLSIMYQQRSSGTTPSPIRVVDLRLG